jgi:hypothetical protein
MVPGTCRDIVQLLKAHHRPIIGNPQGLMHNATLEFARSVSREKVEQLMKCIRPVPEGAVSVKHWRNRIWEQRGDDHVRQAGRLKVNADKKRMELPLRRNGTLSTRFPTVAPDFASEYGRGNRRWVNVLRISHYGLDTTVAVVLPFNTFNRKWPSLALGFNEPVPVGIEGWVFPQQFVEMSQYVRLMTHEEAVRGSLEQLGIDSHPSEPGHIARQIIEQLGGLSGTYLLASTDTLSLLNKMAGGLRRKRLGEETIEEVFDLRTARLDEWKKLISTHNTRHSLRPITIDNFTSSNIIRIGLETECPHCSAKNWSSLTATDYSLACDRCLKRYNFPQGNLRGRNRNWTYRVVGPFSVPDYARGSYAFILALRVLHLLQSGMGQLTFTTARNLEFDGLRKEVDFVAWNREERFGGDRTSPRLVVGEVKSLGKGELITSSDLAKMKRVAEKLPGATIVFAVLRSEFTSTEKNLLKKFAEWGRQADEYGQPRNPLLLLTSHELCMEHFLQSTWKELGEPHSRFTDYHHTKTLSAFAESTQIIYLDMPPVHDWRRTKKAKRQAHRKGSGAM